MSKEATAHPKIVPPAEWLAARKQLLRQEKAATRHNDRIAAARRRLPMTLVEKDYVFDGPEGKIPLADLFAGRRQLIVYHFMFDPAWERGCPGCTSFINAIGDISGLAHRDTSFVLISRAPREKLEAYRKEKGWKFPWLSSFGTSFNYDFHVTLDEKVAPVAYNYRSKAGMIARGATGGTAGEQSGLSVFFRVGPRVYHAYSTYARGVESLTDSYSLLDVTPYGRQEDWEDSPRGWPQRPTYASVEKFFGRKIRASRPRDRRRRK